MTEKQLQYSGERSSKFWKRINALKDEKASARLYKLGCRLQNLESNVIVRLIAAELKERADRPRPKPKQRR